MKTVWRNSGKFDKEALNRGTAAVLLPTIIICAICYNIGGLFIMFAALLCGIIGIYFVGKHTKSQYCAKHGCPIEERHWDYYDVEYYCPVCHGKEVKEYKQQVKEARIAEYEEGAFRALQRSKQTE